MSIAALHGIAMASDPGEMASAPPPAKTLYHIVSLGATARGSYAINKAGLVPGQVGAANPLPALLNQGTYTTLGTTPGIAAGVNDSDAASGTIYPGGGPGHPFYWKHGKLKDLGVLPGDAGGGSYGGAVNKNGAMLCWTLDAEGNPITYVWQQGTLTLVDAPAGLRYPRGIAIDDAGDVAGYAQTQSGQYEHGFVILGGVGYDLGAGVALGINNVGQVVGHVTVNGVYHAYRWSNGTQFVFDPPAGGVEAEAVGINAKGQVVGDYLTSLNESHGFISHGKVLVDLNTLLDPASSGWLIQTAGAINGSGMITGMGMFGTQALSYVALPVASN